MILYFLRHAEAEDRGPSGDASRSLTQLGLQRSRQVGVAFSSLQLPVDTILTSPLLRAMQTAEQVATVLQVPVANESALGGQFAIEDLRRICHEHAQVKSLMLVGHEPDFSYVVGKLIGDARLEMKKGAVACVEATGIGPRTGVLRWLMTGRQMSLIGER
jgi:phosphohistidine phosphatase